MGEFFTIEPPKAFQMRGVEEQGREGEVRVRVGEGETEGQACATTPAPRPVESELGPLHAACRRFPEDGRRYHLQVPFIKRIKSAFITRVISFTGCDLY